MPFEQLSLLSHNFFSFFEWKLLPSLAFGRDACLPIEPFVHLTRAPAEPAMFTDSENRKWITRFRSGTMIDDPRDFHFQPRSQLVSGQNLYAVVVKDLPWKPCLGKIRLTITLLGREVNRSFD